MILIVGASGFLGRDVAKLLLLSWSLQSIDGLLLVQT